jgi:hypothetical protein
VKEEKDERQTRPTGEDVSGRRDETDRRHGPGKSRCIVTERDLLALISITR